MARLNKKGLKYYNIDTDRYADVRIRKLSRSFRCVGLSVYDYILNAIYRNGGVLEWDESTTLDVADYFDLKEKTVLEVINYCCSVGLFNKELFANENIITSKSIQERYVFICKSAKIKYHIDENYILPKIKSTEEIAKSTEEMTISTEDNAKSSVDFIQSKVKESKVNNDDDVLAPSTTSFSHSENTIRFHYDQFMTIDSEAKDLLAMNSRLSKRDIEVCCIGFILHLIEEGNKMDTYKPDFNKHFKAWFHIYGKDNILSFPQDRIKAEFKKFKKYEYEAT